MNTKSPFFIEQEFLSPLRCEEIVDDCNFAYPDVDQDDRPIKTMRGHEHSEELTFQAFQSIIPKIENHYNIKYRGTEPMMFEWYPDLCEGESPHVENSNFVNRKWVRVRDRDFTCVVFLCNYQEKLPFDSDFEVRGGKLEFVQHQFGLNPQIGTLVVFPSGPNFINNTSIIEAGEAFQIRFHIACELPYKYDPGLFPGDYTTWFEHIA